MNRGTPDIKLGDEPQWCCQTCHRHGGVRRLSFGWMNEGSNERHEKTVDLCPGCVRLLKEAI